MNLTDQYMSPIRYEDIKPGDKLIITEIVNEYFSDVLYISIGDIVIVDNDKSICPMEDIEHCKACPSTRGIYFGITKERITDPSLWNHDISCYYKFKTLSGRPVI